MRLINGTINVCAYCPFMERGTLQIEGFNIGFSYCKQQAKIAQAGTAEKIVAQTRDALLKTPHETIPDWCPLPEVQANSEQPDSK